jgi:hypothetical protein
VAIAQAGPVRLRQQREMRLGRLNALPGKEVQLAANQIL